MLPFPLIRWFGIGYLLFLFFTNVHEILLLRSFVGLSKLWQVLLQIYLKWHHVYVFPWIYKKAIILSLFKIDILKCISEFNMPFKKICCLHNLISKNIFFTIKDHSFSLKLSRESWKQRDYKNLLKVQTSFNPISLNIFFTIRDYSVPL